MYVLMAGASCGLAICFCKLVLDDARRIVDASLCDNVNVCLNETRVCVMCKLRYSQKHDCQKLPETRMWDWPACRSADFRISAAASWNIGFLGMNSI